jgi:deazaflavin-dependent oxidoreductase (nitroreductase family)
MWYNFFVKLLLRSPLHGLASHGMILITYTGRKTGQRHTVPVSYAIDDDGTLVTTSFKSRVWWRNLRGGAPVTVRLEGKNVPAKAMVVEEETAVAEHLRTYFRRFPKVAPHFFVTFGPDGTPNPQELAAAAAKRVVICTKPTITTR